MKTLIALGLMTISMNTAFAADNSYADTRVSKGEEIKAERVESDLTLEGRNDAALGGIKFQKNFDKDQPIQLKGRRD
ncbi:hypothetical protein ITG09_09385 [Vibrio cyclitrophicus]|uniref:hypothetical protein n=1 Tax=Vibrio TaxID=662 RepID=UPI00205CEAE3|nr:MULTISPECIES: hypothetical protein [Vibrio]MCX2759437.1 hypothetical protein [Vibrio sp. 14G-20]MCX2776545.1 hypothetical protein [Vibrio sp. Sgm 22]UPR48703.1 hypothetical protein ITG13_05820 [Vibrio cyclitrophicus]UPR50929.1 hypothetical protein ITG09_09385 [Vibrio cyclitrophicus]UWZ96894.1 hypothetical protein IM698_10770 [Vibrio splendidus]